MQASPIQAKKLAATAETPVFEGRLQDLQLQSGKAAKLLKALANTDRLLLFCQLVEKERSVAELGELTGIAQPSLSQQLRVLRAKELVLTRREGKSIFYRIGAPEVHAVLKTLYQIYCQDPLAASSIKDPT